MRNKDITDAEDRLFAMLRAPGSSDLGELRHVFGLLWSHWPPIRGRGGVDPQDVEGDAAERAWMSVLYEWNTGTSRDEDTPAGFLSLLEMKAGGGNFRRWQYALRKYAQQRLLRSLGPARNPDHGSDPAELPNGDDEPSWSEADHLRLDRQAADNLPTMVETFERVFPDGKSRRVAAAVIQAKFIDRICWNEVAARTGLSSADAARRRARKFREKVLRPYRKSVSAELMALFIDAIVRRYYRVA